VSERPHINIFLKKYLTHILYYLFNQHIISMELSPIHMSLPYYFSILPRPHFCFDKTATSTLAPIFLLIKCLYLPYKNYPEFSSICRYYIKYAGDRTRSFHLSILKEEFLITRLLDKEKAK
jgi:hypothetical protein